MKLDGSQRLILTKLQEIQGVGCDYTQDSRISHEISMPLSQVQDLLRTLADEDLISLARTNSGLGAFIQAKGRIEAGLISRSLNNPRPKTSVMRGLNRVDSGPHPVKQATKRADGIRRALTRKRQAHRKCLRQKPLNRGATSQAASHHAWFRPRDETGNTLDVDVSVLKHLRYYLSEVFFRTQEIRTRVGDPPVPYPPLLSIEKIQEISRADINWFNGEGCYLISSCYLAACLFWSSREMKEEIFSRDTSAKTQKALIDLLLKVSIAFLRDLGVFYVTQDAIGQLVYLDEKNRLMTYFEFCDLLRIPEKEPLLHRLINFYYQAGKGEHLDRISEVLRSILNLSDYLDVLSGLGTSVRDRLKSEGLENMEPLIGDTLS